MAAAGNAPFGGGNFLADTSAWTNIRKCPANVQAEWEAALRVDGQISTCPVVVYELGRGVTTAAELEAKEDDLAALLHHAVPHTVVMDAVRAMRALAEWAPGGHRPIPFADALIAATAADRGRDVLHYDRHFQRLERVLNFTGRPLVPFGSI